MQKINEKLITEINKLIDLIHARIEAEASRRGFGTIQGALDKIQFISNPTYENISKIKEQLSVPFQKKLDLNLIYQAKQAMHQHLTGQNLPGSYALTKHRPEDFQGNSRFLFEYFYSPLCGLFKFIDFVIFEILFNHYFSFRLTAFFFPNTIILEQFDKVIKGATLYNAHFDCLAKPKPSKPTFFSKLPEDVLRNITHYLPAKDLEPIFLDRRLHASFKSVIEDYHSATNFLLKTSLKYNIEYIWFINPALLVHPENSVESLILMAKHRFPAQLFETIHPRQLAQNFNSSVEELQRNGISKGVITGRSDPDYLDIYISIFNHNVIENYTCHEGHNVWTSIGNSSVYERGRYLKNDPLLTDEEMAKRIHQVI